MAWETVGWRIAAWDTPLWVGPNPREGRYHRPSSEPTQYVCSHPWGPWAEILRWEDRRTPSDADELRSRIWSVRVVLPEAPRVLGFAEAAALGVDPAALVAEDYAVCQDLADEARAQGDTALVVPSAALPGTENIVVLGPRVLVPWQAEPVDDVDVPAAVTADDAGPPLPLLHHVRWRGAPHAGLRAWQEGSAVPLLEPVPTPLPT